MSKKFRKYHNKRFPPRYNNNHLTKKRSFKNTFAQLEFTPNFFKLLKQMRNSKKKLYELYGSDMKEIYKTFKVINKMLKRHKINREIHTLSINNTVYPYRLLHSPIYSYGKKDYFARVVYVLVQKQNNKKLRHPIVLMCYNYTHRSKNVYKNGYKMAPEAHELDIIDKDIILWINRKQSLNNEIYTYQDFLQTKKESAP
jgi:hypothetical protein